LQYAFLKLVIHNTSEVPNQETIRSGTTKPATQLSTGRD